MLRVKRKALIEEEGRLYFDYKPFTGIAYTLSGDEVRDCFYYEEGKKGKPYRGDPLDWPQDAIRKQLDRLDGVEGMPPHRYQGHNYTGVAFEFDGVFCEAEFIYDNGVCTQEVNYDREGSLIYHLNVEYDVFQQYEWYGGGGVD